MLIPDNFFEYTCHIGCAISLHSNTNSGLIPGGQNSSRERQTVFFTAVNPVVKGHRDPHELDLTKPRLASYKQKKWTRHQDTVYWVDIQLAQRREVLSDSIERHHPFTTHTPRGIPQGMSSTLRRTREVEIVDSVDEIFGEIKYEKVYVLHTERSSITTDDQAGGEAWGPQGMSSTGGGGTRKKSK